MPEVEHGLKDAGYALAYERASALRRKGLVTGEEIRSLLHGTEF